MSTNGYESEFAAPHYTVLEVMHDGLTRRTRVLFAHGEEHVFEVDEIAHRQGEQLADRDDQQNDGGLTWQM